MLSIKKISIQKQGKDAVILKTPSASETESKRSLVTNKFGEQEKQTVTLDPAISFQSNI